MKRYKPLNPKVGFALLRIVFGGVWLIDAFFKWRPVFISGFAALVKNASENQPGLIQSWIQFWVTVTSYNAHHFAILTAITETVIALGLLFGIFTRYVIYLGIVFSLLIWSTAEGFGGPYSGASTDIGAAIIYVLVFIALLLGKSWEKFSIDVKRIKHG